MNYVEENHQTPVTMKLHIVSWKPQQGFGFATVHSKRHEEVYIPASVARHTKLADLSPGNVVTAQVVPNPQPRGKVIWMATFVSLSDSDMTIGTIN
jgi:cold shock CspA family protein